MTIHPDPLPLDVARCRPPCACPEGRDRHHCARFGADLVAGAPLAIGTPCPGWMPVTFNGPQPAPRTVKPFPGAKA